MFTMTLKSDPAKIEKDGRFTAEELNALLRRLCLETGFKESAPGKYYLDDCEDELGRMVVLFARMDKNKYVVPLLSEWISCSDDEGSENLLQFWIHKRVEN